MKNITQSVNEYSDILTGYYPILALCFPVNCRILLIISFCQDTISILLFTESSSVAGASSNKSGTVNPLEAFCTIVRTRLNTHSIVMAGEVDCLDPVSH